MSLFMKFDSKNYEEKSIEGIFEVTKKLRVQLVNTMLCAI